MEVDAGAHATPPGCDGSGFSRQCRGNKSPLLPRTGLFLCFDDYNFYRLGPAWKKQQTRVNCPGLARSVRASTWARKQRLTPLCGRGGTVGTQQEVTTPQR